MTLERIEQHTEQAVLSLAPPWWGKPRIAAFLAAFTDRVQALEDDLWDILELRTIDAADLVRLKVLGRFVGQPRLTFDLETYRTVIKARARANVSKGTRTDILAVLRILYGDAGTYTFLELGNATLYITAGAPVADPLTATVIIPDTRAAGVGVHFLFSDSDPEDVFLWGDDWATTEEWASVRIV